MDISLNLILYFLIGGILSFFSFINLIISVPVNHKGLYYDYFTKELCLMQGFSLSFKNLFLFPYTIKHKEKLTNFIDTRVFSDPVMKYPIICASKLEIRITGSALVRIVDFRKAASNITDLDDCIDKHCKAQLRNQFSSLSVDQVINKQPVIEEFLKIALNIKIP